MLAPVENVKAVIDNSWDIAFAAQLFQNLYDATTDGVGVTRASYGLGESVALDIVGAKASELGLDVSRDEGANLVVTLEGWDRDLPYLACGSHLDSVPQGGNFDGAAGVIAGLAVLSGLKRSGVKPKRTIKLFGLRGEESARFGKAYVGSSALMGMLSQDDLNARDESGQSLGECMAAVGVNVEKVRAGVPLLDPQKIHAWVELHIEQGPVLLARSAPVAVVTGIRGNVRHKNVFCYGEAGHSGAVPGWLRHDAVFATSTLIAHIDRHWKTMVERGRDLVVTCGVLGTDPKEHAIARIPGKVSFSIDIRSQDTDTLEAFYDLFLSECAVISEERGVEFVFDRRVDSVPALLDQQWISSLKSAMKDLGLPEEAMPSGAGHDAAVFANAGIPSSMIFVRNANGSHNPQEAMEIDDFVAGVAVMRKTIEKAIL